MNDLQNTFMPFSDFLYPTMAWHSTSEKCLSSNLTSFHSLKVGHFELFVIVCSSPIITDLDSADVWLMLLGIRPALPGVSRASIRPPGGFCPPNPALPSSFPFFERQYLCLSSIQRLTTSRKTTGKEAAKTKSTKEPRVISRSELQVR